MNPSEDPAVPIEASHPLLLHNILSHHEVNTMSCHNSEDAMNIGDKMVHMTIMVMKVMIPVIKCITSCHRNNPSHLPAVGPYSRDLSQHWDQTYSSPLPMSPAASTSAAELSINPHSAADASLASPSSSCLPPPFAGASCLPNTASGCSNTFLEPQTNKPSSS
jgi:hypothetical protein